MTEGTKFLFRALLSKNNERYIPKNKEGLQSQINPRYSFTNRRNDCFVLLGFFYPDYTLWITIIVMVAIPLDPLLYVSIPFFRKHDKWIHIPHDLWESLHMNLFLLLSYVVGIAISHIMGILG